MGFEGVTDRVQTVEKLLIQKRAQNGDGEVGKLGRTFVELQPTDDAVVGKVLRDASFGNTKVLRKQRFQIEMAAASGARFRKCTDGYA